MIRQLPLRLRRSPLGVVAAVLLGGMACADAGDILRGGASAGAAASRRNPADGSAGAGAAAAAATRANAKDRLSRTTQALQSVRQMQAAARAAAESRKGNNLGRNPNARTLPVFNGLNGQLIQNRLKNVPNGMRPNGLKIDPRVPKDLRKPEEGENPELWIGADLPTERKTKGGGSEVTIRQTESQALLTWRTFNIGRKTTVHFDQSAGGDNATQWIAFNRITDPSGAPSQILGSIKAAGQVYVINQNGIIFGGTSQVNVHTLVASSLPINTGLVERGLLNNPDGQFLFSALPQDAGSRGTPAFEPPRALSPLGRSGDVEVRAGAQIESPVSAEGNGGRIMLVGANVTNAGTISAVGGQTILAAGLQVGIEAHSGSDPSLRGIDVFVGAVAEPGDPAKPFAGSAINSGLIDAGRASVIMTGRRVVQDGVIESSTSASLNGRIDLLANYDAITNPGIDAPTFDPTNPSTSGRTFVFQKTGIVELGVGSVMRILPEYASDEVTVGTELSLRSVVNIVGQAIHFNRDSTVLAPNGRVLVEAGQWDVRPQGAPPAVFSYFGGIVRAAPGAIIDVAGSTDVFVPLEHRILDVELRGAELADSPLQRDGILRGETITVDTRRTGEFNGKFFVGTPLADAAGFVGLIERNVGQLTVEGGTVTVRAGDSVVLERGSVIDASGGWIRNEAGFVDTTRLVVGAQLIDIADATPDRVYDGIFTEMVSTVVSAKYGITETYRRPLTFTGGYFEDGYIEGANGGQVQITAPAMALDGRLEGRTVVGPRQLRGVDQRTVLPEAGQLELTFRSQDPTEYPGLRLPNISPTPPTLIFRDGVAQRPADVFAVDSGGQPLVFSREGTDFLIDPTENPFIETDERSRVSLRADRTKRVFLSPELIGESGFGSLVIDNRDGDVLVPRGVEIAGQPGGSLTVLAANVDILGSITIPGGDVGFTTYNFSPYEAALRFVDPTADEYVLPEISPDRGRFFLGRQARIDVAGFEVDDRWEAPERRGTPLLLDGGTVGVEAFEADLRAGAVVDVSGGVAADREGEISYGDAGEIGLLTGRDPELTGLVGGAGLRLGAELRGFSGAEGGTLKVQAPLVRIGSAETGRRRGVLSLTPEFFGRGGFGSFEVAGIGRNATFEIGNFGSYSLEDFVRANDPENPEVYRPAVVIDAGTRIAPRVLNLQAFAVRADPLRVVTQVDRTSDRTPVSLAFTGVGATDDFTQLLEVRSDVVMGTGASIVTDPEASVRFAGDTVTIRGSVVTPGGTIEITGADAFPTVDDVPTQALTTVFISPSARLSTAGTVVRTFNEFGLRSGYVVPGGTISVAGNIAALAGSRLDVSGSSGIFDVSPAVLGLYAAMRTGVIDEPIVPVTSGLNEPLFTRQTVPVRIDSDAGTIRLAGGEQLFSDATLVGRAGGRTAVGGTLEVSSGRFYRPDQIIQPPTDVNLVVTQGDRAIESFREDFPFSPLALLLSEARRNKVGNPVRDGNGNRLEGLGFFTADRFAEGGFDSLTLDGVVEFRGEVDIAARRQIAVATGGFLYADDHVRLRAPYVEIGTPFIPPLSITDERRTAIFRLENQPFYVPPTEGPGRLTVEADLIDVGNLSLQNIRRAEFLAMGGDIRGNGTLNIAGILRLSAAQIYPVTAGQFIIAAYDFLGRGDNPLAGLLPPGRLGLPLERPIVERQGTVLISSSGTQRLPLEAGGELRIFGSVIEQGGNLVAPFGSIVLGWDGVGPAPVDPLAGTSLPFPRTERLVLRDGSLTSVSGIDPVTGQALLVPFGINRTETSLIDPTGLDITSGGLRAKSVTLGAANLATQRGSVVDLRGGGDLYFSRWVAGSGGQVDLLGQPANQWSSAVDYEAGDLVTFNGRTYSARVETPDSALAPAFITSGTVPVDRSRPEPGVNLFWTEVAESYAVIPGYARDFAPYAPFAASGADDLLAGNPGFVDPNVRVGDRVFLQETSALAAGEYTLLPRGYALLPGAVLVTPSADENIQTLNLPEGGTLVSGVRFNDLRAGQRRPQELSRFEVASAAVFRNRAEYQDYSGNEFLRLRADELDLETLQRLPIDSGRLTFSGREGLRLRGGVLAEAPRGGRGSSIDISTPLNILIAGRGVTAENAELPPDFFGIGNFGDAASGTVVLRSNILTSWGAESLLIGGLRTEVTNGTRVEVTAGTITVQNSGSVLSAPEVILVANRNIGVARDSAIRQEGEMTVEAERLLLGGDGVLLRVSADPLAAVLRRDVTQSTVPQLTIERGATIAGRSLTLDSSAGTSLARRANLEGDAITLNSGQILIGLRESGKFPRAIGLKLSGPVLRNLAKADFLSLLSYSTIDIFGNGTLRAAGRLELHGSEIRGFNPGDERVRITADTLLIDNEANVAGLGATVEELTGRITFRANRIELGANALSILHYADVDFNSASGLRLFGDGTLDIAGNLTARTPVVTAARSASRVITAGGAIEFLLPRREGRSQRASNLGANLTLEGDSVTVMSDIILPSGLLTLQAREGDVTVGGLLDVSGRGVRFFDRTEFTNAGRVSLIADNGSLNLDENSVINVSADTGGGNAGTLSLRAPEGTLSLAGELLATGGRRGTGGSFLLDTGRLPELERLDTLLNEASFSELRSFRVRLGDVLVNGTPVVRTYFVAADAGSIRVSGAVDASGVTGGTIALRASGSVRLGPESLLTVRADKFDAAGKGGSVFLEAGSQIEGEVDPTGFVQIEDGAVVDLRVAQRRPGSEGMGRLTGTLHLRAPQLADFSDLQIEPIAGTVRGASRITVEGYRLYDLTSQGANGALLSNALRSQINSDGQTFAGAAGDPATAAYTAMLERILGGDEALTRVVVIQPGAEIIHRTGDLTLGTNNAPLSTDWNLAAFRYGPRRAPGVLTLRAAGDIILLNSISDGFATGDYRAAAQELNPDLPLNAQSWTYRFTAGADFGSADFRSVAPLDSLVRSGAGGTTLEVGSFRLGRNAGNAIANPSGPNALTRLAVPRWYQVVRTGTGDIDINAGRDIRLLNVLSTIYTAGVRVADPTMGETFDVPFPNATGGQGTLGAVQQTPPATPYYTFAGGNVNLQATQDIIHLTQSTSGALIPDSGQQLPTNWLYRRGVIDPETGEFAGTRWNLLSTRSDIGSTTWWVDFTNFFQGVGALGGGNVRLVAGRDVSNVDAVVPTNARMPKGLPDAEALVELGGGNLVVRAGRNIDGGIYYVERGAGSLTADGSITTNFTRSPSLTNVGFPVIQAPEAWLPTTLFLGKGTFDVSARENVLIGPTVNPFLLPQGYNNSYWYKTYFSTFSPDSAVRIRSLGGDVTLRQASIGNPSQTQPRPILQSWFSGVLQFGNNLNSNASFYRPWLRLAESNVSAFETVSALNPATLRVTAFAGDINTVGDLTLSPSPTGTLSLLARGSINGLQSSGTRRVDGQLFASFGSTRVNVSDANPAEIPGIATPFALQNLLPSLTSPLAQVSNQTVLNFVNALFAESGSPTQSVEQKQTLHAPGLLHRDDPEPIRIYAGLGSISGVELFAPKFTRVFAGEDITDISFYIQHVRDGDISVVAAGRDIVPFSETSVLREIATRPGNIVDAGEVPLAGDIQISGPGTLQVLAGRNVDLGTGANNLDGTGVGITSIGNGRNTGLPFTGASIVLGAGLGEAFGLIDSSIDFDAFLEQFALGDGLTPETSGVTTGGEEDVPDFAALPLEERNLAALNYFFGILRDVGRAAADPESGTTGNYDVGFEAIEVLFGSDDRTGSILTRARDVRTRSGGDITILAPRGELTLASATLGSTLAPPGIVTETGGNISILTDGDVDVGIGRIFTLRGGNQIIWSSSGNIAAGSAPKTVQSAPPTRVILDPSSAQVQTDLAGLATGGGIGVLATVAGVEPGDVDLIAPQGFVDAGDAGIRATGNVTIAAVEVRNATNIAASAVSAPSAPAAVAVSAPSVGAITSAASTAGAATSTAENFAATNDNPVAAQETPSIFTVEVIGYGGGAGGSLDDDDEREEENE